MEHLYVFSAGAAQGLIETVRTDFEKQWGVELVCRYGPVGAVFDEAVRSIGSATPCHVTILTPPFIAQLSRGANSHVPFIRSLGSVETGLIFRDPSIGRENMTVETLVQTLKGMTVLLVPDMENSTGGRHVKKVLESLGLQYLLTKMARQFTGGAEAVAALDDIEGEKAVAFAQFTEIQNGRTPRAALAFPEPYGLSTEYQAIAIDDSNAAIAEAFVSLLSGTANAELRRRCGFV